LIYRSFPFSTKRPTLDELNFAFEKLSFTTTELIEKQSEQQVIKEKIPDVPKTHLTVVPI
jgi:hypothetical protein